MAESKVLDFFNTELLKNKITDASKRIFDLEIEDEEMKKILDALELIFAELTAIYNANENDKAVVYDKTVFFLMDTLLAQMIGFLLVKRAVG